MVSLSQRITLQPLIIYNQQFMKNKQKKKESKQSKKRQLLSVFRQSVGLLQLLTPEQIDNLEDSLHIFVFSRGQCLAKEKEIIDYIGVIAQGRAVAKGKPYQVGDIIGHTQLLGYQQTHPLTITAESDGVVVAIRIIDFLTIGNVPLRNRIINRLTEVYASQICKRQQIKKSLQQFQIVEQKKISKFLTSQWTSFFSNEMDSKEKSKFFSYFPIYRIKQKDLLSNQTLKPSLIYVIQGQLIAKNKQQQKIIEGGSMYNTQGFIFNQTSFENVYCLSNQATVLLIEKSVLQNTFKYETYRAIMKILVQQMENTYKKPIQIENEEGKEAKSWSMFKKYPNAQILPLPKKTQVQKAPAKTSNQQNDTSNLMVFQTLFRDQLGSNTKEKTVGSLAQSGYEKLFTLKTESAAKEVQATLQLQKLRKQVELLSQKLKVSEQTSKLSKLQLIENKSKVNMSSVFKEIRKLRQEDDIIRANPKGEDLEMGQNFVTLKQALDKQQKNNKIQMLVAKCAFKWLYITRKRKGSKKE